MSPDSINDTAPPWSFSHVGLYVKNLDVELEQYVYVYNDTDDDKLVAKIGGGEFAFIPVAVDKAYAVYATKVDTMVEYGVFGNDNSTVPFTGVGAS